MKNRSKKALGGAFYDGKSAEALNGEGPRRTNGAAPRRALCAK